MKQTNILRKLKERIERDCFGISEERTILDALPDKAKDLKKQKADRLRQKKANSAAVAAAQSREKSKSYD